MRPKSYIGVTGFNHRDQIASVLSALPLGADQLVMIGVLVSSKTLRGETNKYPARYPNPDQFRYIFQSHHRALNLLHFASDEPDKLIDDMFRAQEKAGQHCHGFQINAPWPQKRMLEGYKKTAFFDKKTVVLQCGPRAIQECGGSPEKIAQRARSYGDAIDYVLIDPSGGTGKGFAIPFARRCFEELSGIEHIGLGIAGGLSADNVDRLRPLMRKFGAFSVDAEGKLRTQPDDKFDLHAARLYVQSAHAEFRRLQKV
jgi:phosphoribosylanthranilate isomerase